jgi:hypothetical protein
MKAIVTGSMLGLGLLLTGGQSAQALQAVWDVPYTPSDWTRGTTPDSHYAEWNVFNDDGAAANIQDTSPEVGSFGGGTYEVAETTGAAFLTSGGNIYSPSAATAFNFTVGNLGGGSSDTRDVSLLVSTVGAFDTTLNQSFTNFLLNGVAGAYTEQFNETITGGFGGNEVEALITWNDVPNASLFTLTWNAVGSSVSLDQLSIDVSPAALAAVPVPAAAYLMGTGLMALVAMARRKQQAV